MPHKGIFALKTCQRHLLIGLGEMEMQVASSMAIAVSNGSRGGDYRAEGGAGLPLPPGS